jgi:hypothetical protein
MPFFEKGREKIVEERSMGIRATRAVVSLVAIALLISLLVPPVAAGKDNIDMSVIRALAQRPVDEILEKSQVSSIEIGNYWSEVRSRGRPMIVFFYSNMHGPSQRVATLILYVAKEYADRIDFRRVKVAEKGVPNKQEAGRLTAQFSLDHTPGILFYDNVGDSLVLEEEEYVEADFKEFRTPSMFLWKTYYSAVKKELDKLLAE